MAKDKIDFEQAVRNPKAYYRTPEEILTDDSLDRNAKRALLGSWEQDARELSVAESENMAGGEESMLQRVEQALEKIAEATPDAEAEPKVPTMHGAPPAESHGLDAYMEPAEILLQPDDGLDEAIGKLEDSGIAALPVVEGDEVVGLATLGALKQVRTDHSTVRDAMSATIPYCRINDTMETARQVLQRTGLGAVVIVDDECLLAGILAEDRLPPGPAADTDEARTHEAHSAGRRRAEEPGQVPTFSQRPRIRS